MPEATTLGAGLEPHEAGCSRGDPHGGWVEVAVDPIARVDQMESATRHGVAVVLDHEFVGGTAASALDRLEGDESAVVERLDDDRRLGHHGIVGVAEGDDPDGDRRRSCRRGRQLGWAHLDLEDLLGTTEQGEVAS